MGRGTMRKLARIWLSKPPIVCEFAQNHPDDLTIYSDAGITNAIWSHVDCAMDSYRNGTLGIATYTPRGSERGRDFGPNVWQDGLEWFGQYGCTAPVVWAQVLAIRGRDCPQIMHAFNAALRQEVARGCGCFDEEVVITRMYYQYPKLLSFFRA